MRPRPGHWATTRLSILSWPNPWTWTRLRTSRCYTRSRASLPSAPTGLPGLFLPLLSDSEPWTIVGGSRESGAVMAFQKLRPPPKKSPFRAFFISLSTAPSLSSFCYNSTIPELSRSPRWPEKIARPKPPALLGSNEGPLLIGQWNVMSRWAVLETKVAGVRRQGFESLDQGFPSRFPTKVSRPTVEKVSGTNIVIAFPTRGGFTSGEKLQVC